MGYFCHIDTGIQFIPDEHESCVEIDPEDDHDKRANWAVECIIGSEIIDKETKQLKKDNWNNSCKNWSCGKIWEASSFGRGKVINAWEWKQPGKQEDQPFSCRQQEYQGIDMDQPFPFYGI